MSNEAELIKSVYTGFIDQEGDSLEDYRPKLIVNNHLKGQKVLSSIIRELKSCEEFFISVAFITQSGVTTLLNTLVELEKNDIKGKIIASQYLNFTEPKALKRLLAFENIKLRIVEDGNLHAKGYIFRREDTYSLIVGSSNLTQNALSYNKEWNMKVSSMEKGSLIQQTLVEFEDTFQNACVVDQEWIDAYSKIYSVNKEFQAYIRSAGKSKAEANRSIYSKVAESNYGYTGSLQMIQKIMPNKMQLRALKGIENVRKERETKALIVSATGTGKTYLSAFDVKTVKPKKFLFLAHREQILDQSIESYKKVLGEEIWAGKLCGGYRDINADYLFSTIQSMSKESVLSSFSRDAFDYIVIDESHRAGADTYQRIIKYFQPKFLLGMTATPERTDEYNICKDFDYNIAYEIRLQEALQENMLCPFHYFGVTEITVDGMTIEENTEFAYLISEQRVSHIIEKIELYEFYGERVKGLVFCSTNKEAKELSLMFNQRGYDTIALSGANSQLEREAAIKRLEQDNDKGKLDYIFTVNIFNEGVDIPQLNQIVMLRPTQSAIIFVQQLGRGLRKVPSKEYVVILDFIGNYNNNFMIPIALSGDQTYNKDNVRKYVADGSRIIPGASTINFDEISKKRIYESIDQAKFNSVAFIKESYQNLKYRIGRIPALMDFEEHNCLDLARMFESNSLGSYHRYLEKYEKDYDIKLSEVEALYIEFISKKLASGKRPHELIVIEGILKGETKLMAYLKHQLESEFGIDCKSKTIINVANILTNEFATGVAKKTYEACVFITKEENDYRINAGFEKLLENDSFRTMIQELVDFGLFRNHKYYGEVYKQSSFQLYQKYSYEDVCRLLEWEKNVVSLNIGGYKFDENTKTYPVFINYDKEQSISDSIKYEDKFFSNSRLRAISKSKRTPESNDVVTAYKADELGVNMELFVRKNKDDNGSKEFYYLGRMNTTGEPIVYDTLKVVQ